VPRARSLAAPGIPATFHLIRHGEVALSEGDRVYGDLEMPLSPRGVEQLEAVGRELSGERLAAIFCSDLTRARIGAESIARHQATEVPVVVERNLREIFRGRWRNLTWGEIEKTWPGGARRFVEEPGSYADHEGETLTDVDRRAEAAWGRIVAAAEGVKGNAAPPVIAVVSHSWVLRCLVARALTGPLTAAMGLPMETGSIQTLDWTGSRWSLRCFNRRAADRTPLPGSTPPAPTG
jgi:broad specificity phosphatase PhoE